MQHYQKTLKQKVECKGVGLHSGKLISLTIHPAPPDSGIVFVRTDLSPVVSIPALVSYVVDTRFATMLGKDGVTIGTVEHLLSALHGLGVGNALIELDGEEVPVMDGSAAPFVYLMKSAGLVQQPVPQKYLVITRPVHVAQGDKALSIYPDSAFRVRYDVEFDHPLIGQQSFEILFSELEYQRELCVARTFGFLKDVNFMRSKGLALGGSLDNAIVLDEERALNEDGLRFPNEFVRHKALDLLGDLFLLGARLVGFVHAVKSGHELHCAMVRKLMQDPTLWRPAFSTDLESFPSAERPAAPQLVAV